MGHPPRLPTVTFFSSLQRHTKSTTADYLVSYSQLFWKCVKLAREAFHHAWKARKSFSAGVCCSPHWGSLRHNPWPPSPRCFSPNRCLQCVSLGALVRVPLTKPCWCHWTCLCMSVPIKKYLKSSWAQTEQSIFFWFVMMHRTHVSYFCFHGSIHCLGKHKRVLIDEWNHLLSASKPNCPCKPYCYCWCSTHGWTKSINVGWGLQLGWATEVAVVGWVLYLYQQPVWYDQRQMCRCGICHLSYHFHVLVASWWLKRN